MIKRPMKAPSVSISDKELQELHYPVFCSPKLDGIRAMCTGTQILTSSLKPVTNKYIQRIMSDSKYAGLDGELIVGLPYNESPEDDVFNRTTGAVRRFEGEPNFKLWAFDNFCNKTHSYKQRWLDDIDRNPYSSFVEKVEQKQCLTPGQVLQYEKDCLEKGYEGIMIRSMYSPYKEGRCTFREESIFKRKLVEDDEAIIVGFEEQMENLNEKTTNELGLSTRSSSKDNLRSKGTLGAFILRSSLWEGTFNCGTIKGGTIAMRQTIWDNPNAYMGKIVTYKYQKYGSIDKPRQPIVKGFRDENDMSIEQLKKLRALAQKG